MFSCDLMTTFTIGFVFLFMFCVCILAFWCVVTMRFLYSHLYTRLLFKLLVFSFQMHFQSPTFVFSSSHTCWFCYCICVWFPTYIVCLPLLVSFSICNFPVVRFSFPPRSSFSISCKAGLVVLNSLIYCFSVKLLTSLSNLNLNLAGRVFLVVGSSLSLLEIYCATLSWPA